MFTHKIVFVNNGENCGTYDPYCELSSFNGDLEAKVSRCMSWENDMLVSTNLHVVRDIVLPEWLSPAEWIENNIAWGYAWNRGVDAGWSESWQRGLLKLAPGLQVSCIKLLKVRNFRSGFRKSLRDQLVNWLEDPAPKYTRPFSDRQEGALVAFRDVIEAKRADESCYYSKRSNCGVMV
jgi:hypothetical protein